MDLIGVDVGGTKISICIGNERGEIDIERRIPTKDLGRPEKGLPLIAQEIRDLIKRGGREIDEIDGVGLALPGPISITEGKLLTPPNIPGWIDVPIAHYLKEELKRPIYINNDGNAAALAEWTFGYHQQVDDLVYLTMSTGVGGGIIINKKLYEGKTATAGEIGHFVLDPNGPPCPCGQRGCFEMYCGGMNLALMLQREIRGGVQTVIGEGIRKLEEVDMKSLTSAVRKNDPFALKVWGHFIERLAQGIGIILMTLNPELIVLGTIATYERDLVFPPLLKAMPKFSWEIPLNYCKIKPSVLKGEVGLLGALAVAINRMHQGS